MKRGQVYTGIGMTVVVLKVEDGRVAFGHYEDRDLGCTGCVEVSVFETHVELQKQTGKGAADRKYMLSRLKDRAAVMANMAAALEGK